MAMGLGEIRIPEGAVLMSTLRILHRMAMTGSFGGLMEPEKAFGLEKVRRLDSALVQGVFAFSKVLGFGNLYMLKLRDTVPS